MISGLVLILLAAVSIALVPVPFLDGYLTRKVTDRIAGQMTCPGSTAPPPQITLGGGRLLPQLLSRRLSEIRLSVPDTAIGGAQHAAFDATLRGVSQPRPGTAMADSVDASIKIGFADMPTPPNGPRPTFGRSEDGSLTVRVASSPDQARKVKATLFLKLELRGENLDAVPQRLRLFGQMVPAAKVSQLTGGVRSQKLPHLPAGLSYRSITPKQDGLHVALGGVVTTPLSDLPTTVGERTVSYLAQNGLLGISTAVKVPPLIDVPLTIFTAPRLDNGALTLVPQSVQILGSNRSPDELLARLVLKQVKQEDLTRRLPALPDGVRYKSVTIDSEGVKVAVGGVTVTPFSVLSADDDGRKTAFGAQDGFLTATAVGTAAKGSSPPIVLFASPRIVGNTLDLAPQQIQMFGTLFPAANVLSEIKAQSTVYPLQELPAGLTYTGVDVLPDGLRITVSGTSVALSQGLMGGTGCASDATP